MKPPVSDELRQRVLDLCHRHTQREVAEMTGLPLGTVKTLCSRSGAFRDNPLHRALFTLPPIRPSAEVLPAVPNLPPQVYVTGDCEVDAVLWLRQVIQTGQAALIEKALEAAKRISTPLKVLEQRYAEHLAVAHPGNALAVVFGTVGFADLEGLAEKCIAREHLCSEAAARFGGALFDDTEAEVFCSASLAGLEPGGPFDEFDAHAAAACFTARPELLPNTLGDCLHELAYWCALYRLRHAVDGYGDLSPGSSARERFVFGLLAQRKPRSKREAVAVFRYLVESGRTEGREAEAILLNLIGSPAP